MPTLQSALVIKLLLSPTRFHFLNTLGPCELISSSEKYIFPAFRTLTRLKGRNGSANNLLLSQGSSNIFPQKHSKNGDLQA